MGCARCETPDDIPCTCGVLELPARAATDALPLARPAQIIPFPAPSRDRWYWDTKPMAPGAAPVIASALLAVLFFQPIALYTVIEGRQVMWRAQMDPDAYGNREVAEAAYMLGWVALGLFAVTTPFKLIELLA